MGIVASDEVKTTMVTRYVSDEFLAMRFGVTTSPTTFCNFMNDVFHELLNDFVVVYLDDSVVYITFAEHLEHLRRVFG